MYTHRKRPNSPRNIFAILNYVNSKYSRGATLTFQEAIDRIVSGKWIYLRDRAYHPRYIENFSIRTLKYACESKSVFEAIETET